MKARSVLSTSIASALFGVNVAHAELKVCDNAAGFKGKDTFYSWHVNRADADDCLTMYDDVGGRHFRVTFSLGNQNMEYQEDAIGGMGWRSGSASAVIHYKAALWKVTGNATLSLYGWTCEGMRSQEYYVVENWGTSSVAGADKFVPWDAAINSLARRVGTVRSDAGVYDIYITKRMDAPHACHNDLRTFYQYWSVRQNRNSTNTNNKITFARHANAWSLGNRGFVKSAVPSGYQIMAIEGLASSSGVGDLSTWK
jgi:hypothetical protein